jgi:hypothetical protein
MKFIIPPEPNILKKQSNETDKINNEKRKKERN